MFKRSLTLTALLLLISGCGYRGALYLPENAPDNTAQSGQQNELAADDQEQ